MKILQDVDLSAFTTIRIGGIARKMLIPESADEMLKIIEQQGDTPLRIVGGGSNLLIANRDFDVVVNIREMDKSIHSFGNGMFRVGASVRLQKLINTINEAGFGGIEYLYSVPGCVGGSVAMNAGEGGINPPTIADYLISVEAVMDGVRITLLKEDCRFSFRNSAFKNHNCVILAATFQFPEMREEKSAQLKSDRLALCKRRQDSAKPNFGSVFSECSGKIMWLAKKLRIGNQKVHFSEKTPNWLINEGGGTYEDAIAAIRKVEFLHRLLGKTCCREVITWE